MGKITRKQIRMDTIAENCASNESLLSVRPEVGPEDIKKFSSSNEKKDKKNNSQT